MGMQAIRPLGPEAANTPTAVDESWNSASVYLPGTLLEALLHRPDSSPRWIEPLEGTLLLADVSGFTSTSELLAEMGTEGAELLTSIINQYFQQMLDIASSFGGSNAKFAGDALLLVFTGEDHANRAVATALGMQRAARRFPAVRIGPRRLRLGMSMGVHSGRFWSAAAGLPGLRMQHFLLGPEVSRLAAAQTSASSGEILITPETQALSDRVITGESKGDAVCAAGLSRPLRPGSRAGIPVPAMPRRPEILAYLPPPIALAVERGEVARATPGEHRRISVAFINVMGTNDVLEAGGPDALLDQLDHYLASVLRLSQRYGAYLLSNDIDVHGLKLILLFGAPVAHEEDATNSLRLAAELNGELPSLGISLQHRIGLNRGLVFAGDVGARYRREYTVMGDVVNLSARLMASAAPGQVLVSRDLALEAGRGYLLRDLAPVRVKGKREPVRIWALEGQRSPSATTDGEELRPLVGREEEMKAFSSSCEAVEAGHSRTLIVSGEAGIGKTRLVLEWEKVARARGWAIQQGRCYSHTVGHPYAPWVQVLGSLLGFDAHDSIEARTQGALGVIARLRPEAMDAASLLNPLLSLDVPQSELVRALDDEGRRLRLFNLIAELLEASSRISPLLLIFKDMQWADPSSAQLIGHVSASAAGSRLALCLTTRHSEEVPLTTPQDSTLRLPLAELPENESLRLLQELLPQQQLSEQTLAGILERSGGNPLFIEEVAGAVQQASDSGQPLPVGERRQTAEADISDRVQSLIMPRIDALDPESRDLFRAASVAGMDFDAPVVAALVGVDPGDRSLAFGLEELERRDFIVRTGPGFRFRHTLVQEVAYDSLAFVQRRRLHGRAASFIERLHPQDNDALAHLLFHHYDLSGDTAKTVLYGLKAGDRARQVFASEEALKYYRRGLEVLQPRDARFRSDRSLLLERVGDCLEVTGQYSEAAESFIQARRAWQRAEVGSATLLRLPPGQEAARQAFLCYRIARACERGSDYDASIKWLDAALDALPPRQPMLAAHLSIARCVSLFRKGEYREAIEWGRRGLALSRRTRDPGQVAEAHTMLASPLQHQGRLREAARHLRQAVALYIGTGDLPGQARASGNLGACYDALGGPAEALYYYDVALKTYERVGNRLRAAIADNNIGEIFLTQGRLDEAAERFSRVVSTYEQAGQGKQALCGYALLNLSRVYHEQGRLEEAQKALSKSLRILRGAGARVLAAEARLHQAELQLAAGRPEAALRTYQRAQEDLQSQDARVLQARGLRIMARIAATSGSPGEEGRLLRQSVALAQRLEAYKELAPSLLHLAQFYVRKSKGSSDAAAAALRRAAAIFRRLGAEADAARCEAYLGELLSATA